MLEEDKIYSESAADSKSDIEEIILVCETIERDVASGADNCAWQ
jgi:hypothetical protein